MLAVNAMKRKQMELHGIDTSEMLETLFVRLFSQRMDPQCMAHLSNLKSFASNLFVKGSLFTLKKLLLTHEGMHAQNEERQNFTLTKINFLRYELLVYQTLLESFAESKYLRLMISCVVFVANTFPTPFLALHTIFPASSLRIGSKVRMDVRLTTMMEARSCQREPELVGDTEPEVDERSLSGNSHSMVVSSKGLASTVQRNSAASLSFKVTLLLSEVILEGEKMFLFMSLLLLKVKKAIKSCRSNSSVFICKESERNCFLVDHQSKLRKILREKA